MLRPLFRIWFSATQRGRDWLYPAGPSEVSIAGSDPIRVLVIGDGPAAGCGVLIHDRGFAAHLAGQVASVTKRGVVVTVAAQPTASARSTLRSLEEMVLDGYDCIILMLTTTDVLCLTSRESWRRSMQRLVDAVNAADAASVVVTSVASVHLTRPLKPFLRRLISSHAGALNRETYRICLRTDTPVVVLSAASELATDAYARWGRDVGMHVAHAVPVSDSENQPAQTGE
ncbi:hypothetical protein [Microbacterium sp. E-13]|uniref:hypothetical protein n=1 Tax=Microbacterium sp. E-13 TaxID=3404048 RepID=UPI003CE6D907